MPFVYILRSLRNSRFYTGSTNNLEARILQHNCRKTKGNKGFTPFELVYQEEFPTLSEARRRENYIKRQKSRQFIEKLIEEHSLI